MPDRNYDDQRNGDNFDQFENELEKIPYHNYLYVCHKQKLCNNTNETSDNLFASLKVSLVNLLLFLAKMFYLSVICTITLINN